MQTRAIRTTTLITLWQPARKKAQRRPPTDWNKWKKSRLLRNKLFWSELTAFWERKHRQSWTSLIPRKRKPDLEFQGHFSGNVSEKLDPVKWRTLPVIPIEARQQFGKEIFENYLLILNHFGCFVKTAPETHRKGCTTKFDVVERTSPPKHTLFQASRTHTDLLSENLAKNGTNPSFIDTQETETALRAFTFTIIANYNKGYFSFLPLQQTKNRKNFEKSHFSTSTKSSEKRERLILLHEFESDMRIYNRLRSVEFFGAIPET